jgi:ABC-type branched-subunit amino acid transport system substrate-binding protein
VPTGVAAALYCTTPVLPLRYYPHGNAFRSKFRRMTHRTPTAYTYYGYLAGSLVLQAIRGIGRLDSRQQVMSNLVKNNASALLTTYTFDNGDLSGEPAWDEYGLDKMYDGIPRYYKLLTPTALLQSES